jgi:hypothetical protein
VNGKAARRGFYFVTVLAVLTILLFPIVYADWHSTTEWTISPDWDLAGTSVSPIVTISNPQNTTYSSSTIPVTLSASGGTIDKIWYNVYNGSAWLYPSNLTYTVSTSMLNFVNGTDYKFYGWANNTDGISSESTVMFSVSIYVPPPPPYDYITVILNGPSDGYSTTDTVITFTYTPYTSNTLENASLWLNNTGTWQLSGSNTTALVNSTTNSITYMFLTYGTFVWNIQIYNTTTSVFANANFTLTLTAPVVIPADISNIFYFCPDTQTINTVTGYKLSETQPNYNASTSISASGNLTGYVAYRVFIVYDDGDMVEISTAYIGITGRTNDTEGLINATWACPRTKLDVGFQALRVEMYMQIGSGGWIDKATFISGFLNETAITNSTWIFQTYTKHAFIGGNTILTATWGTNTANSLIDNVGVTDPDIYDLLNYQLHVGNFIGFLFMPYTNLVGNLFYGLLLLVFFVPLYNRYKSFSPIIILLILFGGAGGILSLMVPEAGLGISWIFLIVGIGGLIYKVFR